MQEKAENEVTLIRRLLDDLSHTSITELEWNTAQGRLRLRRRAVVPLPAAQAPPEAAAVNAAPADDPPEPPIEQVTAPAVGRIRYRNGLRPGVQLTAGEVIGTVEALGISTEVAAATGGRVKEVLRPPGSVVEYGEALVVLDPEG
ncbi:MAG: hypothetical protein HY335_10990 [Deinococcus sp.]|nr:hypothetical protein [Deinococcus sp.]